MAPWYLEKDRQFRSAEIRSEWGGAVCQNFLSKTVLTREFTAYLELTIIDRQSGKTEDSLG